MTDHAGNGKHDQDEADTAELQTAVAEFEALRERLMPKDPNPKCRHCYGRGHIGKNRATGKFKPCPRCYPGALESAMTPHEIIQATEIALADPQQCAKLVSALERADEDGFEEADKVLEEAEFEDIEGDDWEGLSETA